MADITGVTNQTSSTSGANALAGIQEAVTNINDDYVSESLYDANSILYATTDNTPVALTVGASTIVGRKSSGNIVALTATETRTILNVADGSTANSKASGSELDTGTDDVKFATAKAINDSHNVPSVAPGTSGNVMISNGTDWVSSALTSATSSLFGNGADGSVTYDGSTTILGVAPSGSAYTLNRDIYCVDLTVNNGVTINTAGYRIYVRGTLTVNATAIIQNNGGNGGNGGNASASTGGTAGSAGAAPSAVTVPAGSAGVAGSIGGVVNAVGIAGNAGGAKSNSVGVSGAAGGAGGTATGNGTAAGGSAGAAGTATASSTTIKNYGNASVLLDMSGVYTGSAGSGSGGSGAASNASGGNNAGGGSGGSGGSGGFVFIFAFTLAGTGTIKAIGGNGGNGGNAFAGTGNSGAGGGGTGAGGAGGIILIFTTTSANPYTLTVTGGTAGQTVGTGATSGTGYTGANGSIGSNGTTGAIFYLN